VWARKFASAWYSKSERLEVRVWRLEGEIFERILTLSICEGHLHHLLVGVGRHLGHIAQYFDLSGRFNHAAVIFVKFFIKTRSI
jgi:hypothetical protein